MAYGLSTRMHLIAEPRSRAVFRPDRSTSAAYAAAWTILRHDERLALVERALNKAA